MTRIFLKPNARLAQSVSAAQYFCVSFGCIVGVGWMTELHGLVASAGPLGTAAALILAGAAITLVATCYSKMSAAFPRAGGELVYAYDLGGPIASFATGWVLVLLYVVSCAFLSISFGTVASMLFPDLVGPIMYRLFGQDIRIGATGLGLGCAIFLWWINRQGTLISARVQEFVTYVRLALVAVFLIISIRYGQPANNGSLIDHLSVDVRIGGLLSVLATAPFLYSGFSVFAALAEESRAPMEVVGRAVASSVVCATVCYVIFSICTGVGSPMLSRMVLALALLGNFTAWNSFLLAGSRVLFALGRAGFSAPRLGTALPRQGTPAQGIALVSVATVLLLLFGKGFLMPLAHVGSVCFCAMYVLTCAALVKSKRFPSGMGLGPVASGGRFTALGALSVSVTLLVIALVQPFLTGGGHIPPEWMALGYWAVLGAGFWFSTAKFRGAMPEAVRAARLRGQ